MCVYISGPFNDIVSSSRYTVSDSGIKYSVTGDVPFINSSNAASLMAQKAWRQPTRPFTAAVLGETNKTDSTLI